MQWYISLHRDIQDHWIYKEDRVFSRYEAWLDLVMMANHAPWKFVLWNELVEVQRWEFISSELKLMKKWGWGKTKIRCFLDILSKDEMIVKKTDSKKTSIFILNYDKYQDSQTTKKPRSDRVQTDCRPRSDTNNNVNNSNNENNKETIYIPEFSKDFQETYKSWIKDRKDRKKPVTEKAIELQLKRCRKWGEAKSISIIQKAIEKWWSGLEDYDSKNQTQWSWKPFVDYEAQKKETLAREAKANKEKEDFDNQKAAERRKDDQIMRWFESLPEDSELKKNIEKAIDENKTIKLWFEWLTHFQKWTLMYEQKLESANKQRERLKIVVIKQFYQPTF